MSLSDNSADNSSDSYQYFDSPLSSLYIEGDQENDSNESMVGIFEDENVADKRPAEEEPEDLTQPKRRKPGDV